LKIVSAWVETLERKSARTQGQNKEFALRIVRLYRSLPRSGEAQVMGRQLLRSGTSVAANYRAACRARSRAEFLSRLSVVLEEADESVLWIELLVDSGTVKKEKSERLLTEARQLTAIFTAATGTIRRS
jgi:four helix bundle protein